MNSRETERVGTHDAQADLVAIRDVLARYMRAMRLRDVDLMDAVFTPDAVIDYTAIGGAKTTWRETKAWLQRMIDVELFMLFVGDVYATFTADGCGADVESTWHGVFVASPESAPLTVFGTYDDRFVRTAEGWRIVQRTDHPAVQVAAAPNAP